MNTFDILNKRVSLLLNIKAKSCHRIPLFEALNMIRIGTYQNQLSNLRRLYRNNNPRYTEKKKHLPSFIFSGSFYDTRFKFDVYGYTSLLVIDIDKLESVNSVKEILNRDSHVVATWISPSGSGLKVLFYLEYDKSYPPAYQWIYHEHCAFPQVENYLRQNYGINIDPTGNDITRLCFVSYDPEIHLKKEFEPFIVSCDLSNNQVQKIRYRYYFSRKNVRNAMKEQIRIAKLLKKASADDKPLNSF